ncbi:MAG TPA: P1 family peptidase [Parvibaculum sp.]|jgi:L-aminopeptidase/D-esterase-like protein
MNIGTIRKGPRNLITDVDGIRVGNAEDANVRSGATVILPDVRAVAAVDARGGAPGTRETDALDATCLVDAVDAVVLSGGSVYGLDAASGATAWLGARGRGYGMANAATVAPVIPAAILFDLTNGGDKAWGENPPYNELGRKACAAADKSFALGNAGAGLGARAGSIKGGLGSASAVSDAGFQIGALIAVNPYGSVLVPGGGHFWAAPYELDGEFGNRGWPADMRDLAGLDLLTGTKGEAAAQAGGNTTIGCIAVNADLTPAEARRIAIMAQDGLARAIRPIHTPFDGDVLFVLATGTRALDADQRPRLIMELGGIAADCVARAVARGVYEAETLGEAVSYRSRHGG